MKLLIVLIASAQRGRRESPSQTCSLSFYSFLGYVKIPTQINSSCCKMLYHRGSWNLATLPLEDTLQYLHSPLRGSGPHFRNH